MITNKFKIIIYVDGNMESDPIEGIIEASPDWEINTNYQISFTSGKSRTIVGSEILKHSVISMEKLD